MTQSQMNFIGTLEARVDVQDLLKSSDGPAEQNKIKTETN